MAMLLEAAHRQRCAQLEGGFVMPFAVLASIAIVIAAVLLAARANYSLLGSNRQLLFTSAREAAEYGFSEAIAKLNTDRYGYLLVTNWDQWQSNAPLSDACGLAVFGAEPNQKFNGISSNSSNAWRVLPAATGQPSARYQITNYVAPRAVNNTCLQGTNGTTRFGNLWGGDGRITIRGELINANNQVLGQFILNRKVHVKAFAGPGQGESSMVIGTSANISQTNLYFDSDANGSYNNPPDSWLDIYCVDCAATTQAGLRTELGIQGPYGGTIYKGDFNYGEYPNPDLSSLTAPNITTSLDNYPYTDSTLATLRPECKNDTLDGVNQVVCQVSRIDLGGNRTLRVRTAPKPVSIFITGSGAANPVIALSGGGQIINNEYTSTSTNNFARLRIYGLNQPSYNSGSGQNPCNLQTTSMTGNTPISGAFMWLPNGTISYTGGGSQAANYYGVLWGCRFASNSSNSINFIGPSNGLQVLQSALNADVPLGTVRYRAQGVMDPG
ncbi:hypothetical protein I1E95_11565 [Synechococcus sp. CBW1107]|uniref:hypothetical protein n=1 Tax=Synechococcus sp. CBW1107 TaxID=2789857 RepID=UPI0018CEA8F3|nr:hypothetical protein [Synechococcus sp. CBW1107]QPN55796.1 hypothetical protein I1E95_11565 [Synechococcus sp. CBW1107]